jgi:AraC-like DNA-binding protein
MIFETHTPCYPLNYFVDGFIYYEGYNPEHSIDRFLPDGNTEIIIDLTDTPKYIYDNETLKEIQACHHVWVSGVRTSSICIPSGKESRMFIISFKKGMAFPFYPMPLNELTDYVVDADLVFGSEIIELREKMLESKHIAQLFSLVENFLLVIGGDRLNINTSAKCIEYAVTTIIQQPNMLNLQQLSEKIGYSQKHFIDLFKKQVGISPKPYLKIMRFQKAILDIEHHSTINWSNIALESGYYDQAHFINDFKIFSGLTPNDYLLKKNNLLNYIPIL